MTKAKTCGLDWQETSDKSEFVTEHAGKDYSLKEVQPGKWSLTYHHEYGYRIRKCVFKVNDSREAQALACKRIKA